eukprot:gene12573-26479_t
MPPTKNSPQSKKQRVKLNSPLSDGLTNDASKERLKKSFSSALPYQHVVLEPLCNDERMRKVCDEVKSFNATFKETDLFKVFQSMDFGNIDANDMSVSSNMQELLSLRDAIYAPEFRAFISEITGCGELTDRVDCAANAYVNGCHLMCHDDVIGNRRVSYIIYLSDPDDPWLPEDGGYLELYPLDHTFGTAATQGVPSTTPTALVPPKFNTMAMFNVLPGCSYHAVQEVFVRDKPRLTIQGWYHGPCPPEGSDMASLKQILHKGNDDRPFIPIPQIINNNNNTDVNNVDNDSDDDIKEGESAMKMVMAHKTALSRWINPIYLQDDAIKKINEGFCKDSSLLLHDFLREDVASDIQTALRLADKRDSAGHGRPPVSYEMGSGEGWRVIGPTHKRRHMIFDEDGGSCDIGRRLRDVHTELLQSSHFSWYIHQLTTLKTTGVRGDVRRFRPGLDYTVAHYGAMTSVPRLDATLCFVSTETEDEEPADSIWENGDVGGFECYIGADEEEADAAEVYRTDTTDDDQLLSVSSGANVLSLVMRDEGVLRFVKYVSVAAPSSRWDVAVEYEIESESVQR